ncbi:murein hydrolase activator NlpD [Brenneria uluponensis]|uniref:murein hydrolase activator NlpD n=1 Tax=Brenneria uluponensis TaxID=3057057 RepID=UPI0028E8CE3E|nr:murein hydrolase activator NlpD [Brenneria ulupoensis]
MGGQIMNWQQIAACMVIVAGLASCSNSNNRSAPISSVNGGTGSRGGMMSSPTPRITSPSSSNITTHEGKIVYNRSYSNIPKGSYTGTNYIVKRGDTLFYIAWISGNDYRELAQRNGISEPYSLNVGQTLTLGNNMNANGSQVMASNSGHMLPVNATRNGQMQTSQVDSQSTNAYSGNSGKKNVGKMLPKAGASAPVAEPRPVPSSSNVAITGWRWPTEGKVIDNFSAAEGGNKGIDIAGSRGQPVVATAGGRVVYAGNALRGYGNLIIIKHNDDYLSAYAHNETMLVREQQEVKAGQKIATMGSTGTSSVRLHFEIRYKGKSVNPLRFLSQR